MMFKPNWICTHVLKLSDEGERFADRTHGRRASRFSLIDFLPRRAFRLKRFWFPILFAKRNPFWDLSAGLDVPL